MSSSNEIDALLIERAGYVRRGLPDRVAQVDEQLRLRGYDAPAAPDEGAAQPAASRGRRTAKA
jgi:hypothetical protein